MFRRHHDEPQTIDLVLREDKPDLRNEPDPDPVVEAAAERLRQHLSSMEPMDEWGRPVAWRQVARIALGDLASSRVRDALTADTLADAVVQRSVSPEEPPQWRTFFRAVDQADRLLGDQARSAPQR